MERRKLFSAAQSEPKKRKLFSDFAKVPERRKIFCNDGECEDTEEELNTLVCQDCGYQLKTNEVTTECICPNCGSHRFNNLKDMSAPPTESTEIDKAFSEIRKELKGRRKIFSSLTKIQPNTTGEGSDNFPGTEHPYCCSDCHSEFENISETPTGIRCPKCGGNRVVRVPLDDSQKEFSDATDATDEFLKEFSGKTVDQEGLQKLFSVRGINETAESLLSSGYATELENGDLCINEGSYIQRKLFSKLVISVTKELDLDPVESKEALIHRLIESDRLPERSIMLIKKAHNLPTQEEFSDNSDEYIKDSGIENDLKLEYGGRLIPLKEFMAILSEQYNDAPENILDILVSKNIIKISGSQVEVLK